MVGQNGYFLQASNKYRTWHILPLYEQLGTVWHPKLNYLKPFISIVFSVCRNVKSSNKLELPVAHTPVPLRFLLLTRELPAEFVLCGVGGGVQESRGAQAPTYLSATEVLATINVALGHYCVGGLNFFKNVWCPIFEKHASPSYFTICLSQAQHGALIGSNYFDRFADIPFMCPEIQYFPEFSQIRWMRISYLICIACDVFCGFSYTFQENLQHGSTLMIFSVAFELNFHFGILRPQGKFAAYQRQNMA